MREAPEIIPAVCPLFSTKFNKVFCNVTFPPAPTATEVPPAADIFPAKDKPAACKLRAPPAPPTAEPLVLVFTPPADEIEPVVAR